MTFLNKGILLQQLKQTLSLFLVLIVAGLAGNYFRFPIFLNIDFLFGSIFAMLALQFFGLGRGISADAIIAGYTYILWKHKDLGPDAGQNARPAPAPGPCRTGLHLRNHVSAAVCPQERLSDEREMKRQC